MFNGWRELSRYADFIKEQWGNIQVWGWAAYVAKEKLIELKNQLRCWSRRQVGDVGKQVARYKKN